MRLEPAPLFHSFFERHPMSQPNLGQLNWMFIYAKLQFVALVRFSVIAVSLINCNLKFN